MEPVDTSESLLTEILLHLQVLNSSVEDFKITLEKVSRDVKKLETKVDDILEQGFHNKDLKAHRAWHAKMETRKSRFLDLFRR